MTIHMKSLGITVQEIGLVFGIVPPLVAFSPFAIGVIADKLGNFKVHFKKKVETLKEKKCHD